MPVFHHEITIAKPVEAVFGVVADVHSHPRWQEGLLRGESESNMARVGAEGAEVRRMFGREVKFLYRITVYDPPHAWGFEAPSGPVRPSAVLTFSSQNGGTHIDSVLTVPGIMGYLMGPMLLSQQKRNYVRLKELLESGKL